MMAELAVLMAAYNSEDTLPRAVASVLRGPVPLDLHIVDDGSRIPVAEVLDPVPDNVFIYRLDRNIGLAAALNHGLEIILARPYRFVARFDADDICYPDRFAVQLDYLAGYPDLQAVGAHARVIDAESGRALFTLRHPEHHAEIVRAMRCNAAFLHPTLLFRAEALRQLDGYNPDFRVAQDFELMWRAVTRFRTGNVPQIVMDYTWGRGMATVRHRRGQLLARLKVQWRHLDPLDPLAWWGIVRSCLLLAIPVRLLDVLKQTWKR